MYKQQHLYPASVMMQLGNIRFTKVELKHINFIILYYENLFNF
jgi:hypothetical protein